MKIYVISGHGGIIAFKRLAAARTQEMFFSPQQF